MRRIFWIIAVLPALAGAVAGAQAAEPRADLPVARVTGCEMSGPNRSAVFYARMSAVPGAVRLTVRFTLFERLGRSAEWTKVDVPELRQWRRSAAGVRTFGFAQTVDSLRPGGAYKARIQYRWLDANGAPLDTVTRETAVCRGPLPNMAVGALALRPGPTADTAVYRVTVVNNGKGEADGVDVRLEVDQALLDAVVVDRLSPGESRTLSFTGPRCNQGIQVRIDPDNGIGEILETDNAQAFGCP
jgi:hypothetical protein